MGEGRRVAGKRAGQRAPRKFRPVILPLAVGITLCVVAWGYLVKAAIDFGTTARGGESRAWAYLGLASLGAIEVSRAAYRRRLERALPLPPPGLFTPGPRG